MYFNECCSVIIYTREQYIVHIYLTMLVLRFYIVMVELNYSSTCIITIHVYLYMTYMFKLLPVKTFDDDIVHACTTLANSIIEIY